MCKNLAGYRWSVLGVSVKSLENDQNRTSHHQPTFMEIQIADFQGKAESFHGKEDLSESRIAK